MRSRRVLFRCDAGAIPEIGTGHLVRDLLLAERLQARGVTVAVTGRFDDVARAQIAASGIELISAGNDEPEADILRRAVVRFAPQILVLDRLDSDADAVAAVRSSVPVIISLDDLGSGARLADVVVNAMVGDPDAPFAGLDYAIVPRPQPVEPAAGGPVVISLGGHDHGDYGREIARGLAAAQVDREVVWIVGRPVEDAPDGVTLLERPHDFSERLRSASVAVVNGGLTLVEACANGVATVAVAQYDHQRRTIGRLASRGAVVAVDAADGDIAAETVGVVRGLLDDEPRCAALRSRGPAVVDGGGVDRVADLLMVFDRLPWDTDFFGVEIARIYPQRLTEQLLDFALEEAERIGSRCVYYLCDCHHAESVRLAEAARFSFVDIRLTLERSAEERPADPAIRDAREGDLPAIEAVARHAYEFSRYYFDHQFSREDCERFYSDWVRKCVLGELAERTFVVVDDQDAPLGYIAVSRSTAATAVITLLGVSDDARGQGVARRLIDRAVGWAAEQGASRIEVVTQGRNYGAQRAYMRAGFLTAKNELWYHLWRH